MKKKILIIGGTGFLGYHLAKKCISYGWLVHSVSTNKPKPIRYLKKVKYIILDITNKKKIKKKISYNYDHVINFGGYVNHKEKRKTYASHYSGCKNLVDFFVNKKIKSFIQIGSCIEYGFIKSPQKENMESKIENLKSTYGKAKFLATKYLIQKYKDYKFPCTILRLYLVYGPRQDYNRLIPIVIRGCIKNKKFPTSNGNQSRSFLFVDDFIRAVIKCLNNDVAKGQIFNVGNNKPIKLKKVISLIRDKVKNGNPEFGKIKLRKDELLKLYPNIQKIKKKLNWEPKVSFNKGLIRTINYYKKNL